MWNCPQMNITYQWFKSTLDQVMAWCHQAPCYYLIQCWPRSMLPYSITRPWWVNSSNNSPTLPTTHLFQRKEELFLEVLQYIVWHIEIKPTPWKVQMEISKDARTDATSKSKIWVQNHRKYMRLPEKHYTSYYVIDISLLSHQFTAVCNKWLINKQKSIESYERNTNTSIFKILSNNHRVSP